MRQPTGHALNEYVRRAGSATFAISSGIAEGEYVGQRSRLAYLT